jgi:hypothetical protein
MNIFRNWYTYTIERRFYFFLACVFPHCNMGIVYSIVLFSGITSAHYGLRERAADVAFCIATPKAALCTMTVIINQICTTRRNSQVQSVIPACAMMGDFLACIRNALPSLPIPKPCGICRYARVVRGKGYAKPLPQI